MNKMFHQNNHNLGTRLFSLCASVGEMLDAVPRRRPPSPDSRVGEPQTSARGQVIIEPFVLIAPRGGGVGGGANALIRSWLFDTDSNPVCQFDIQDTGRTRRPRPEDTCVHLQSSELQVDFPTV